MSTAKQRYFRSSLKILGAIVTLHLIAFWLPIRVEYGAKKIESAGGTPSEPDLLADYSFDEVSETLLMDTILSIVQSYYVDRDRVDNDEIIRKVLLALSEKFSKITVQERPHEWAVSVNDEEIILPAGESYFATLKALVDLSQSLERHKTVWNDEKAVKNRPGSFLILNTLLNRLDAHSSLLGEESYKELRQGTDGTFGGLGVLVGVHDRLLTVLKPIPNSPASRAGVRRFDKITSISGVDTFGFRLEELVEYMRGEPGTEVDLVLLRKESLSPISLLLRREVIQVDSVESEIVKAGPYNVLHIGIENFAARTSSEVLEAIRVSRNNLKNQLHGLILDLRSNPGGLLDQAVQVADLFLNEGVIVSTRGRRNEVEYADLGIQEDNFPVVVLINGDTASASEIVAAALQDHHRSITIGQPSFGKGSVQTVFELPGQQALKLTVARYYSPLNRTIQNIGVTPDIWLQPIYKANHNQNLMGIDQHSTERYLQNHLEEGNRVEGARSVIKNYYLRDPMEHLADDQRSQPDPEMEVALDIIRKTAQTYGPNLPMEARRSSHWLAISLNTIRRTLDQYESDAKQWLHSTHQIDWRDLSTPSSALNLNLGDLITTDAWSGGDIEIPFQIENQSERPASRVSIIARGTGTASFTQELLVGIIEPKTISSGSLKLKLPAVLENETIQLQLQLAQNAAPRDELTDPVKLNVHSIDGINVSRYLHVTKELGGVQPGVLEPGESMTCAVTVTNQGSRTLRNLSGTLTNLSGSQISLTNLNSEKSLLKTGEATDITFLIRAEPNLVDSVIKLGLEIHADELAREIQETLELPSLPHGKANNNSTSQSH